MTEELKSLKLWWFVNDESAKNYLYRYVFDTFEKMIDKYAASFTIVHPENSMYSLNLREYNRKYIDLIYKLHSSEIKTLIDLNAPDSVISSATLGFFSRFRILLDECSPEIVE